MRIKTFSDIDCIHPTHFPEITLACTREELKKLLRELGNSYTQQVKVVVLRKNKKGIMK